MSPGEVDAEVVHGYLEVDLDILHRVLSEELDDLAEFAEYVERYLASAVAGDSC